MTALLSRKTARAVPAPNMIERIVTVALTSVGRHQTSLSKSKNIGLQRLWCHSRENIDTNTSESKEIPSANSVFNSDTTDVFERISSMMVAMSSSHGAGKTPRSMSTSRRNALRNVSYHSCISGVMLVASSLSLESVGCQGE